MVTIYGFGNSFGIRSTDAKSTFIYFLKSVLNLFNDFNLIAKRSSFITRFKKYIYTKQLISF